MTPVSAAEPEMLRVRTGVDPLVQIAGISMNAQIGSITDTAVNPDKGLGCSEMTVTKRDDVTSTIVIHMDDAIDRKQIIPGGGALLDRSL
ncbi:MAG: hypothetical protein DMG75_06750 [Acidobacteria bacterium]|nr:MAG: hypothetical protein DMG75_06750 [Acidobacteriota bacterium]